MSKTWWAQFFLVITAIVVAGWLPIHFLYFDDLYWADAALDVIVAALVLWSHHVETPQKQDQEESGWSQFITTGMKLLIGLPIASVLGFFIHDFSSALFLKLLILKELKNIPDLLNEFDSLHPVVYRLVPLVVVMPLLVHLDACIWIWLGSGSAGPNSDHVLEYAKAVYWAFTTLTTVGYGDISAVKISQMAFACFTQVLGVGVFGFVLSNVASLLARLDAAREHHMSVLDRVETFMRYNQVPVALRGRIRAYYRYLWETHKGYDDSDILHTLPQKLRAEISFELNKDMIEKVTLLKGADKDLVQDVVMQLQPVICIPGEKIFHVGEPGEAMYFIHNGTVQIVGEKGETIATLKGGSFFGERALLKKAPRSASAIAMTYCDLFVLSKEAFEGVLHRYPEFEKHIHELVQERLTVKAS